MIRRFISSVSVVLLLCFSLSGCVWAILGAGAVGGYAISKDTIVGEIDSDYDTLWLAAERVGGIMGEIKAQDRVKGTIELDIDRTRVSIQIEKLTPETLRLRVKGRKYMYMIPNIGLAQKVFIKIQQQVEE